MPAASNAIATTTAAAGAAGSATTTTPKPATTTSTAATAKPPVPPTPPPPEKITGPEGDWTVHKGKLSGPDTAPSPKGITKVKDPKSGAITTENCWNYGKFAVVEMRASNEIGAAEVTIRYASPEHKNLCAVDWPGRYVNLKISEVYFAGVAGDYVVMDGADGSEGLLEFQIFNIDSGKLAYKGHHHPAEDLQISKKGSRTSLEFFAKADVKCEMVTEGKACWKKVLALNKIPASTPMPDCKSIFTKTNTPDNELALVTVKARIADVTAPKISFIGGRATCAPAP